MDLKQVIDKTNPNYGDIDITGAKLSTVNDEDNLKQIVAQRIINTFETSRGEWYLNVNFGYPYMRHLGQKRPSQFVDFIHIGCCTRCDYNKSQKRNWRICYYWYSALDNWFYF